MLGVSISLVVIAIVFIHYIILNLVAILELDQGPTLVLLLLWFGDLGAEVFSLLCIVDGFDQTLVIVPDVAIGIELIDEQRIVLMSLSDQLFGLVLESELLQFLQLLIIFSFLSDLPLIVFLDLRLRSSFLGARLQKIRSSPFVLYWMEKMMKWICFFSGLQTIYLLATVVDCWRIANISGSSSTSNSCSFLNLALRAAICSLTHCWNGSPTIV